ncbi:hypothetical protein QFC22_006093 [Naganishia vaughanmartiniae]|uniref:Uncharacterized protein n=1 Tax=Naganishia vaughanmartiniae TaxID=1424756 RepID=A0ACC2WR24_9TREE|nr:hypothetical protein QFC22_006093 [Naganishia vaughanmartiniae]
MDNLDDDPAEDDDKEPLFPPSPPRRTRIRIGDADDDDDAWNASLAEGMEAMSVSERLGEALATDIGLPRETVSFPPAHATTSSPGQHKRTSFSGVASSTTFTGTSSTNLRGNMLGNEVVAVGGGRAGSRILVKKPLPSNADRLKAEKHKRRGSKASWSGFTAFWSTPTTPLSVGTPPPNNNNSSSNVASPPLASAASTTATTETTSTSASLTPSPGLNTNNAPSASRSRSRSGSVSTQPTTSAVQQRTFEPAAAKTEPVVASHTAPAHGVGTRSSFAEQRMEEEEELVVAVGQGSSGGGGEGAVEVVGSPLAPLGNGDGAGMTVDAVADGGLGDIDRLAVPATIPAPDQSSNRTTATPLSSSDSLSAASSKASTATLNSIPSRPSPKKDLSQGGEARKSLLRTLSALPSPPTESEKQQPPFRTPSQVAKDRLSVHGKDLMRGSGTRAGRSSSIVSVFTSASTDTSSGRRRSRTTTSGSGVAPGGGGDMGGADEEDPSWGENAVQMKAMVKPGERPPPMLLRRATAVLPHSPVATHMNGNGKGKLVAQQLPSRFEAESKQVDLEPYIDRYGFVYHLKYVQMLLDLQQGLADSEASEEGERDVVVPHTTTITDTVVEPSRVTVGRHRSATIATFTPSPSRPTLSSADEMVTVPPPSTSTPPAGTGGSINIRKAKLDQLAAQYRRPLVSLLGQLAEMHDKQEHERMKKWHAFLKYRRQRLPRLTTAGGQEGQGWNEDIIGVANLGDGKIGRDLMKRFLTLVHTVGIPIALRASVWAECSGAKEAFTPGEYQEILAVHQADTQHPTLLEIEKDVRRTFPTNVFFGGDGVGCDKLRRCLTAYSWRDPQIGYCQGMNLIAATLLLTYDAEEQAYWTFVSIIKNMLPDDWFTPSLQGSMIEQSVINDLVDALLPDVAAHLREMGVEVSAITFGWILSIFANCLPIETVLRVWDCFMVEGRDVIPCTVIAILKLGEQGIMACDNVEELFEYLNTITERLWTADKLVSEQFKASITSAELERRRKEHLEKVTATADGTSG